MDVVGEREGLCRRRLYGAELSQRGRRIYVRSFTTHYY